MQRRLLNSLRNHAIKKIKQGSSLKNLPIRSFNRNFASKAEIEDLMHNFQTELKLLKKTSTRFFTEDCNTREVKGIDFKGKIGVDPADLEIFELEAPKARENTDHSVNYPSYSWMKVRFPFKEMPQIR